MDFKISDPKIAELIKNKRKTKLTPKIFKESKNTKTNTKTNAKTNNNIKTDSSVYQKLRDNRQSRKKVKIKAPSTKALSIATKQLASMVKTGLPLLESLNILSDSSDDKTLKYVFKESSKGISRGSTFLSMLEKYPEVFDEMYLALISAGEEAGLLPDVLEREALLLESLAKIKGQIASAMAYPIAIFTLTIIVVIVMLVFVIPIFVDIYSNSGTQLPMLTNILVIASEKIKSISFMAKLIPFTLVSGFFIKKELRKNYFINWKDEMLLKLPITKDLVTKSSLANFARTLSALNSAGVPILESLTIARRTLGNRVFKRIVIRMNEEIQSGEPIYKVLASEKYIPVMFTSMFRIGEETGELSEMVNKLADFYEEEVSSSVKSLTSILEPLMIVFVASVVAVILVAMYLPMFNMMSTVN